MSRRTDFQIRAEWRYAAPVTSARIARMLRVYIISRGLHNGEEYATVPVLIIPRIIWRFLSLPAPWSALMETRISFETVDNKIPRK